VLISVTTLLLAANSTAPAVDARSSEWRRLIVSTAGILSAVISTAEQDHQDQQDPAVLQRVPGLAQLDERQYSGPAARR